MTEVTRETIQSIKAALDAIDGIDAKSLALAFVAAAAPKNQAEIDALHKWALSSLLSVGAMALVIGGELRVAEIRDGEPLFDDKVTEERP